ncbi:MAG: DsbA family protein [Rhizobiaceae bacterium]
MISNYYKTFAATVILASSLFSLSTPALAFDANDKPAVEKIIREYLLQNPELILEVQQALEQKQQLATAERSARALSENKETVFNSPNQAAIGNPNADVTVVEFFDYNCGFCQRAMRDMNSLLAKDAGLQFVLKELPILSEGSVEAHKISTAVYRLYPKKYEEFHNKLLGGQGQKDGNRALRVAQEMKMDVDAISNESKKGDVLGAFREVNDLANKLGINGTPSYVIGNEVVFGALGEDVLRQKIENVRKCGKTVCS